MLVVEFITDLLAEVEMESVWVREVFDSMLKTFLNIFYGIFFLEDYIWN